MPYFRRQFGSGPEGPGRPRTYASGVRGGTGYTVPMSVRARLRTLLVLALSLAASAAPAGVVLVAGARTVSTPVPLVAPAIVLPSAWTPGAGAAPLSPSLAPAEGAPAVAPLAAAVLDAVRIQARELPSAAPLAAYAERAGLALDIRPFSTGKSLGLDSDNLAQYDVGARRVFVNWDYVGGDRRAAEDAGLSPRDAAALTGLLAAPVAAHEWRHAELRDAYGSDFPGLAEEEILTHLDQAAAMEEALPRPELAGRERLAERMYLFPHSRRLVDLRRRGFGPLADFVLRRYRDVNPTLDDPARASAEARALLARLDAAPAEAPRGWREKARANADFWESPEKIKRLTAFLQDRINAAYAALGR